MTKLDWNRIRGNIIEACKILYGKYDPRDVELFVNRACIFNTGGNDNRLQMVKLKFDLHKYCCTNCVVNIWDGVLRQSMRIYQGWKMASKKTRFLKL